ncbi:hypothetical protein [Treponema putidum]|uniref:hypothetical protein n=1 Tax=Treponema putidum TaxID=221027 RepID=UPI003D924208
MDENLDLFCEETESILIEDIKEIDKLDKLNIEIDDSLEKAITEMNALENEYSKEQTESLIDLCKDNVMQTIVGQFGLASLFIESQDGGSVTTTHNFEKGIVSSEKDKISYQNYDKMNHGGFNEKRPLYDERKNEIRSNDKGSGKISVKDEYTGKTISIKNADIDHVVSAKEIESNSRNNLFLSQDERVKMGTDDLNFAYTRDKANRSKGSKKMLDWLDKERSEGMTNEEAFGIDKKLAIEKDKNKRKAMSKTINKAAFKKYSSELFVTGGKDAAKMAAYSAIGVIIHDFALAVVEELKFILHNSGQMTFREIFVHFKEKMKSVLKSLKEKWKDIFKGSFEAGITAFLSNILVFVINLFATTLKKLVSMIRAGFVSLCQSIKMIANRPDDMAQEEANYQAAKILTAGIIGALSLGLSAAIEKFLQSIPGLQPIMMFPIPSFGKEQRTVSDVIAVALSAVAGGLVTTVVLYFMDKCREKSKKDRLQIQMITTSGVIVECKVAKSWLVINNAYDFFEQIAKEQIDNIKETFNAIEASKNKNDESLAELASLISQF